MQHIENDSRKKGSTNHPKVFTIIFFMDWLMVCVSYRITTVGGGGGNSIDVDVCVRHAKAHESTERETAHPRQFQEKQEKKKGHENKQK